MMPNLKKKGAHFSRNADSYADVSVTCRGDIIVCVILLLFADGGVTSRVSLRLLQTSRGAYGRARLTGTHTDVMVDCVRGRAFDHTF